MSPISKPRRADYLWLFPLPLAAVIGTFFEPKGAYGILIFGLPTYAAWRGRKWGFGALAWIYALLALGGLARPSGGGIVWFLWMAMTFWYCLSRIESWPHPEPASDAGVE
jgi:hypothetical protein